MQNFIVFFVIFLLTILTETIKVIHNKFKFINSKHKSFVMLLIIKTRISFYYKTFRKIKF